MTTAALTIECLVALGTLTPDQRETWIDHHLAGLTRAQLADRDHVSVEAIRQRIDTAQRRLETALQITPDQTVLVAA